MTLKTRVMKLKIQLCITGINYILKYVKIENVPGYVCNPGSPRERDAASRCYGERHQRCPALNHMCNQSKLTARRQVRVTS